MYLWQQCDSLSGGDFSPAHPNCNQCSLSHWIMMSGMLHLILCRERTFVGCFNSSMGKGSRHFFLALYKMFLQFSSVKLLGIFCCMVSKVYRKSTTILPLSAHVLVTLWFQGIVAIFLFISSICASCSWSEVGNSPPLNQRWNSATYWPRGHPVKLLSVVNLDPLFCDWQKPLSCDRSGGYRL